MKVHIEYGFGILACLLICLVSVPYVSSCSRPKMSERRFNYDVTKNFALHCSSLRVAIFVANNVDMHTTVQNFESEKNYMGEMGAPFLFRIISNNKIMIVSAGYDSILGTKDDLIQYCDVSND